MPWALPSISVFITVAPVRIDPCAKTVIVAENLAQIDMPTHVGVADQLEAAVLEQTGKSRLHAKSAVQSLALPVAQQCRVECAKK